MTEGPFSGIKAARLAMGLSRADITALARRAGFAITTNTLNRIEERGQGGRGLTPESLAWLESLLGIREQENDWATVEAGAPVVIDGEKGSWQFRHYADEKVTAWGGEHNRERYQDFPAKVVRVVASTTLPDPDAPVFKLKRGGGVKGVTMAARVLAHCRETSGAHGVAAIAYSLGVAPGTVSEVAANLVRRGDLRKVARGVFVLADEAPAGNGNDPAGKSRREALAERVGAALENQ